MKVTLDFEDLRKLIQKEVTRITGKEPDINDIYFNITDEKGKDLSYNDVEAEAFYP